MISALFLLAVPTLIPEVQAAPSADAALRARLRIGHWEEVELHLPEDLRQSFEVVVPGPMGETTLVLERHSNRSEDFQLLVQIGQDELVEVEPPPVSTYRGVVAGEPQWHVAATLMPHGLKASVRHTDGSAWFIEPKHAIDSGLGRSTHLVYTQGDLELGQAFCGSDSLGLVPPEASTSNSLLGNSCFREAEIAFDADFENFVLNGSDVGATTLNIEASLNAVNDMYAREVAISHTLTLVIVRSVNPDLYPSFVPGTLLDSFRNHWNSQQGSVVRDVAHLATGKEMDGNIIGLAWVGVVCNQPWSYGLTQYNLSFGGIVSVLAHELGHNWNAPHCLDASPCNNMCGGCLNFGPVTTQVILDYRNNVGCLTATNGYATPVPPKVLNETLELDGTAVIDVLANDFDGNCDTVVIQSFDALSAGGGTVELSVGTGSGGRDELSYLPSAIFEGLDSFSYVVGDGTGLQTPGLVSIELYDDIAEIALHYRMDESSGSDFIDSSGHGIDGNHIGSPQVGLAGATAQSGTAVAFDGAFSRGSVPGKAPLNGLNSELALSVWLRPDVLTGNRWIFGNKDSWHLRLNDGVLIFRTTTLDYAVSPNLPLGSWSHVAAVFDSSLDVTFYINGIATGTIPGDQPAGLPQGSWLLAGKGTPVALYDGRIDDLQVYDNVLDAAQIMWLFEHPGEVVIECEPLSTECTGASNSAGPGASIGFTGSASLETNDLSLTAFGCPPNKTGIFYYGPNEITVPFGDGLRCVGGAITRLSPLQTDALGFVSSDLDLGAAPFDAGSGQAISGQTMRFQFWYRDPDAGGAGFNLSDALVVKFCL